MALQRLRNSETPHLAASALRRLIERKMREVTKHNVVRRERFSAQLEDLMIRYMRQQLTSAQLIVQLVELAKQVSADARRGHQFDPPLNHAELAFYDAVAQNGAATELMGVGTLAEIARELVKSIQSSITVGLVLPGTDTCQAAQPHPAAARPLRLSTGSRARRRRPGHPPDGDVRERMGPRRRAGRACFAALTRAYGIAADRALGALPPGSARDGHCRSLGQGLRCGFEGGSTGVPAVRGSASRPPSRRLS